MENTNIEYFNEQLKKFINEIIKTFPEYNDTLSDYYNDLLNSKLCNDDKYVKRFMRKMKDMKIKISKKDNTIFDDDIYILKNVNFREIWVKDDLSNNNRETIWEYIQMLFVIGETIISDCSKITDLMHQFKSLKEGDNNLDDMPETDEAVLNMLKNLSESTSTNNIDESLFKDGMIGKLAQELSEEINMDIDVDQNDENSTVDDVFSNLISGDNPMKFMNLVQTVGNKIQNKVSNGELNQEKLIEEAQGMMGMLTNNNPLLNNLFKQTEDVMQNNYSDSPTRERLRKKLASRKNK